MRQVIKSDAEPGDGVSIERDPMTNTELTLDQLQTINGGHLVGTTAGPGGTSF